VIRASYTSFLRQSPDLKSVRMEGLSARLSRQGPPMTWNGGNITVDQIAVDRSHVEIERDSTHIDPFQIGIAHADLNGISASRPIHFHAQLDLAKPHGPLDVQGVYGPFSAAHPETAPVSGTFRVEHADLAPFHGLEGTLTAQGKFSGPSGRIHVDAVSDIANLKVGGQHHHLVNITAKIEATVNGANADAHLDLLETKLLGTDVHWTGDVTGEPDPGKTARLEMTSEVARIQDLLYFVTQDPRPLLYGPVSFRARVVLPPGPRPFLERVQMDGDFNIADAQFGRPQIQSDVVQLSERARGEKKPEEDPESIVSDIQGHVSLRDGIAALSNVSFRVHGASASLQGTYSVINYVVDLHGQLALQKELSDTTSGIKSFLLKALDPIFKRKRAGAVIPVSVTGTYDVPVFKALGMRAGGSSESK
jgi:hypothetical protein